MPLTVSQEQWEYLTNTSSLRNTVGKELAAQEARRMELAKENMLLMAELSTARTKIAEQQAAVEQYWRDSDGHNYCWVNPKRLFAAFGLIPKPLKLPPLDERMEGCKEFWRSFDANPCQFPDFTGEK